MRNFGTLNEDVQTQIFLFIDEVDLPSIVLVNRAFCESATPLLYRSISCTSKKSATTPFETLEKNAAFTSHVQSFVFESSLGHHPEDHAHLERCRRILEQCEGLRQFRLDKGYTASFVHQVLQVLSSKSSLREIELSCEYTIPEQDGLNVLTSLRKLRRVALKEPSWQLINKLPEWMALNTSLTVLEITSSDLDSNTLESMVVHLPGLTELKIMSCSKIQCNDLLQMTKYTPLLERLSLSIWLESNMSPPQRVDSLGRLSCLTLDMKNGMDKTRCTSFWKDFLTSTSESGSELTSLTLQCLRKVIISPALIKHIGKCHGNTLTSLELRQIVVTSQVAASICSNLFMLEELALTIPGLSITSFAEAFSLSSSLRSIRNIMDRALQSQTTLNNMHVREIANEALSVTSIECQGRKWTIMRKADNLTDYAILYTPRGGRRTQGI